ncbi:MAG: hypothetical protein AAGF83_11040 [Cyanobacteria bacterium P01_G01_bin.67]
MSEVNQNTTSFDSASILSNQSNPLDYWSCDSTEEPEEVTAIDNESDRTNDDSSVAKAATSVSDQGKTQTKLVNGESSGQKMNWQRVAHKLREYNRKLIKKVFRLEQELAEIDNKFNKYVEKSQSSDLLLAQQAEEIEKYQEKVTLLAQQLAKSQQQVDAQEILIQQISEQHELSQRQTAQLERECTLLQEQYNLQAFELASKEQESQELQIKLNQQQQSAQKREAELKRYQEAAASRPGKAASNYKNYPHNRYIQPWSTSTFAEPKIALPRNKTQTTKVKQAPAKTLDSIKTAAEIATWSATATSSKQANKSQPVKPTQTKKPQSLAAVDLPTFPRPQ